MATHTIEVVKKTNGWKIYTSVWGSPRETFSFKSEKRAVRKAQELERSGYVLVALPRI